MAGKRTINIGDKFKSKYGCILEVVDYKSAKEIYIKLEEGDIVRVESCQLRRGTYENRNKPTVLGIGYLGYGMHKAKEDGVMTIAYNRWCGMLNRCYKGNRINYNNVEVHPDWHNFQNYAEWFYANFVENWEVDKDILSEQHKIYSKDTCAFVPREINALLNKRKALRGNLKIGVSFDKEAKKFVAQASGVGENTQFIGYYNSESEAHTAYKIFKENKIKILAERYKHLLDSRVYEKLINYEVGEYD